MTRVSVQYSAFGAMAVSVDGVQVSLTRRRERTVLSVLLAAHGAPVAAERLVAEVWVDEAPGQTLASLQVAVSRLRSQLQPGRRARTGLAAGQHGGRLFTGGRSRQTSTPGPSSRWPGQALTAGTAEERLRLAEEARARGRPSPYADRDAPVVLSETSRLDEPRLTLEELRARVLLDLGRADEALRAAGRARTSPSLPRTDVVAAGAPPVPVLAPGRRSRDPASPAERLADELGVDPSEEIRTLEEAVLRQDPSLTAPAAVPTLSPSSAPARSAPRPFAGGPRWARSDAGGVSPAVGRPARRGEPRLTRPRFLLVAGEPGIGKSRLVSDLGVAASARGMRVLVGRCHEDDYAPALRPWLGVVRALSDGARRRPAADASPGGRSLADARSGVGHGTADVRRRRGPARPAPASSQSLLLVLEDIHWADATSLQLLRHLATSRVPMPVAVLCTRRTTEAQTGDALVDTLAVLAQAGRRPAPARRARRRTRSMPC